VTDITGGPWTNLPLVLQVVPGPTRKPQPSQENSPVQLLHQHHRFCSSVRINISNISTISLLRIFEIGSFCVTSFFHLSGWTLRAVSYFLPSSSYSTLFTGVCLSSNLFIVHFIFICNTLSNDI
jgi:hypothetical protein